MLKKIIFALFVMALCLRPFLTALTYPREDIFLSIFIFTSSFLLLTINISQNYISKPQPFSSPLRRKNTALFSLGILFLAVITSTLLSQNINKSFPEFYKYSCWIFVFLATLTLSAQKQKVLFLFMLANSMFISIYAFRLFINGSLKTIDYMLSNNIQWDFAFEFLSRYRAFMPFILPADLAGYLILFLPVAAALLFSKNNDNRQKPTPLSIKNIYFLILTLSTSTILLSTQSLGAIAGLLTATFIFISTQKKIKINTKSAFALILFLSLGLILMLRTNNTNSFNFPSFSLSQRISYWKHAIDVIRQHPVTGIGPGNYPFFKSIWAHNAYLQIWAETGILGIIGLLGVAVSAIKINMNTLYDADKIFIKGLWIGSLAFLIHNLVDTTFFRSEVSLHWWVVSAILCTYRQSNPQEPGNR